MNRAIPPDRPAQLRRGEQRNHFGLAPRGAMKRDQLAAAVICAVRRLDHEGRPSGLDLRAHLIEPGSQIARAPCQRDKRQNRTRKRGFDFRRQIRPRIHRLTGRTRKRLFLQRLGDRGPVRRYPDAAPGQFCRQVRDQAPFRRNGQPDEIRLRTDLAAGRIAAFAEFRLTQTASPLRSRPREVLLPRPLPLRRRRPLPYSRPR